MLIIDKKSPIDVMKIRRQLASFHFCGISLGDEIWNMKNFTFWEGNVLKRVKTTYSMRKRNTESMDTETEK